VARITDRINAAKQARIDLAEELIPAADVAHLLRVSTRTVWRLVEAGHLPEPVRFNRKLVRWRASDIRKFLESLGDA
jgi:excisionase family DNA binding protein